LYTFYLLFEVQKRFFKGLFRGATGAARAPKPGKNPIMAALLALPGTAPLQFFLKILALCRVSIQE